MTGLVILVIIAVLGIGLLLWRTRKASVQPKTTTQTGATGTTPPTPASRIPNWIKSGKIWSGLGFWLLVNGAVWFFHHYASLYFSVYNPWPLFLAINVVFWLWVVVIFRGTKGGGKFLLFLASWFLIGVGLLFYSQSPTEFKAQAAADEARLESQLPRSGEKVIMAPVGKWETISFPAGSKSWYYDQGPHHIKLQNLAGWKAEDYGAGESVETPKGDTLPKRTFQFMSLEETPVQITLRWE